MRINRYLTTNKQSSFYEEGYRVWFESFLPYLTKNLTLRTVTPAIAHKYQGDFYGLLDAANVPIEYHYYVMLTNGYQHPGDYDGVNTDIQIPDLPKLEILKSLYLTANEAI